MPPKKAKNEGNGDKKENTPKAPPGFCGGKGPGPKYQLKTGVGYNDHCLSKLRNPAYSMGKRPKTCYDTPSPGPKYVLPSPKLPGYTFGGQAKSHVASCSPGPKYNLPDAPKPPIYSMKWKIPQKSCSPTPGPYLLKPESRGPAYSLGLRLESRVRSCGPLSPRTDLEVVKQKAPRFSITGLPRDGRPPVRPCVSPGPKYDPKIARSSPIFSFGTKHHPCAPPYIVECDDDC